MMTLGTVMHHDHHRRWTATQPGALLCVLVTVMLALVSQRHRLSKPPQLAFMILGS
jgi:hypothetical protein